MEPIEVNVPITCGGVLVNPGDIVLADEIGVVVVPQEEAEESLEKAREQAAKKEETRKRIQEGKTVEELLREFGWLEDIGHAAAFLASDEASFITGTQLFVDGDLTAQLESW